MKHVYRTKNWVKVFSLFFLGLSLFFSYSAWEGFFTGNNTWLDLGVATALFVGGAVLVAHALGSQVILSDDSICHRSVFGNESLRLDQIRCRREYQEHVDGGEGRSTVDYPELVTCDPDAESIKIQKDDFDLDHAFWEWVLRIPESK